jgi:uncharacterized protein
MPSAPGRPWLSLLLWLSVLLPITGWLFVAQLGQRVDPTNAALKSPGTRDAANLRDLAGVVATDQVVLLVFVVPGGLPILPIDAEQLDDLREVLGQRDDVTQCRLLPAPEPGLAMLAVSLRGKDPGASAQSVVAAARSQCPPALRLHATGVPLIESTLAGLVAGERRTIVPMLAVVLFLVAWLLYRRAGLAFAALLPAMLAIVWTSGLVAVLGHPLDPIAALLDPVLLTIGVATSVHFVEAWRRGVALRFDSRAASLFASTAQRSPTLLATATTMLGLLSLTTSPVPAVVDFGLRAAFGVALVHVFTFTLLPVWLGWQRHAGISPHPVDLSPAASWLGGLRRFRPMILGFCVMITTLAVAGLPRLWPDNDPMVMLPANDVCRIDSETLATRLGGVEVCHLFAPQRSPATDPARLLPFLAAAQQLPGIAGMAGPVLRGPEGDLAAPLLLRPGGSAARQELFGELESAARVMGLDGLVPAGVSVQIARDSDALMRSLGWSTLLTLVLLGLGMCIGLRSLRLGALGMLANILPCAWIYGAVGWSGHPVSVATGMIGCTMLGLIVDNTLHLLHQYRELRPGSTRAGAMRMALDRVGRPMWLSSGLLLIGFATAATSRLHTTIEFSLLACSTIVLALFGCGVLLPILLIGPREVTPEPRGGRGAL